MKPSHVSQALRTLIAINRPAFVWGAPGVGKSNIVAQVAAELGRQLIDIRAVLLDPVDLRGLPHVNGDGRAHWATPAFLPRDGEGILFLDELNAAPPLVQAACYQLVLDRKLGEYTLPDGWAVLAAGNRETDRAVTSRMPSALANRFIHLDFEPDLDDWCQWALQAGKQVEVVAFLRFRPNLLHAFDPDRKAFSSPRSWAFASDIVAIQADAAIEYDLLAGAVGEGEAAELLAFLKVFRQLPSPDAVLMTPDTAPVPDDPATVYALCGALARKASPANFDRIAAYARRLSAEFGVLLVKDAVTLTPDCQHSQGFIAWATDNGAVLT
ncbi:MAG: MoxR family ATPase [Alphaproteobacteria bacterium]|nr:MoxR family ATPase [Alphaproteobacteria bacterium]